MHLHVQGQLWLREPNQSDEDIKKLGTLVSDNELPLALGKDPDGKWRVVITGLEEGEEDHLLRNLALIGKELPGLLSGGFEVWWPFAVESGPQRWILDKGGKLCVYESSITWDAPVEVSP